MRYTVVLYGHYPYEPGDIVILRVEAESPGEAARLAQRHEDAQQYDATFPHAVFAKWHDDLLPPPTVVAPLPGDEDE